MKTDRLLAALMAALQAVTLGYIFSMDRRIGRIESKLMGDFPQNEWAHTGVANATIP